MGLLLHDQYRDLVELDARRSGIPREHGGQHRLGQQSIVCTIVVGAVGHGLAGETEVQA